ncbi:hypothetical protein DPMN_053141 [Dreissena polymorpha]|uniref:Mab-21-like HhH/H2TH-like domain-containing protein n=1 Tax=Dreissena polymorpha TaxID=45954 RepID=A0A9D4HNK0_DREPO|nr:hypothetical protein DPMN_053141 [Dreissena polymorpha]
MTANAEEARSLHLSTVLEDIGVSKGVILLRRNTNLTVELLVTAGVRLDVHLRKSERRDDNYWNAFGYGFYVPQENVSRSSNESDHTYEEDYIPFRVLRNEVFGGYASDFVSIHDGQMFLKTTLQYRELRQDDETRTRHGPAITDDNRDLVKAFETNLMNECKFVFDRLRHWPKASTMELAKKCLTFFVPQGPADRENRMIFDVKSKVVKFDVRVGIDDIVYSDEEFRFSSPTIERLWMFDLDIVQLKAYVTLKMIRKELFKKVVGDRLSTFHFKTALLWTVETYPPDIVRENNLENCIMYCLVTLRLWMGRRYCPHYTIRDDNLCSVR